MTRLKISDIRRDGGTQTRESLDYATVTEYADAMTDGVTFPPVVVYYDGSEYWLADGFHRIAAAKQIGTVEVDADVEQGTKRDAILHSVGANTTHGLRRTTKDKRRAVTTLLRDDEWRQWSDREIARRCSVSHPFVEKVRQSLTGNVSSDKPDDRTYTTKHGTTATMNTENIGRSNMADAWTADQERKKNRSRSDQQFYEPDEEEPHGVEESFNTEIDDAIEDIKRYVDETLRELRTLQEKHAIVNDVLKYLRALSIKFNQEAS